MQRMVRLTVAALAGLILLTAGEASQAGQATVSRNMTGCVGVINPSVTGLGLPLAKKICIVHGGNLVLEHTGPTGSRFAVTLPLEAAVSGTGVPPVLHGQNASATLPPA